MAKAMTLRLSDTQAEELETLAKVEGVAASEVIREALADLIEAKKKDAAFRKRVRKSIARNQKILDRLGK